MQFRRIHLMPQYEKTADDGSAAATTASVYMQRIPLDCEVVAVHYVPRGSITADDTNYATIKVEKADGAGGAVAAIAQQTTKLAASGGSGNCAAGVPVALPLLATPTEVKKGEVLSFAIAKAGSGVVVRAGVIDVLLKSRRKA